MKLKAESGGDWEVIVPSWLLFRNRVTEVSTDVCQSALSQWLPVTMKMQTIVLQNQNGINVIKIFKITENYEGLNEENEKISNNKKFCMGLEKRNSNTWT